MKWLRWLHENEDGFFQFLLPLIPGLILGMIQKNRQDAAQREIEQSEEAEIPGEEGAIREELAQRGLSQTSAAASQVGRPRKQFEVSKRVARAKAVLGQPTVDPFMITMQYLAGKMGQPSVPTRGGGGSYGGGSFY